MNPDKPAAMTDISFCFALCSRRRPVLLKQALESILSLDIPDGVGFSILVVENDDQPQYAALMESLKTRAKITYVVEPVAGLTCARNRVLTEALALGVDWIGCIDDDVTISRDWLQHMAKAISDYPDTHFFLGNWLRGKNPQSPDWYPHPPPFNTAPTGRRIKRTAGGNIALKRTVFSPDGMGLKYDHRFRFVGGEDTDFTLQYLNKGGIIRSVIEARGVLRYYFGKEREMYKDVVGY